MIDQRWAIIAHLDILAALDGEAKCRLVLVDLEAGRHAGNLCVQAREWERRTDVFSIPTDDLCVSVPVEVSPGAAGTAEDASPSSAELSSAGADDREASGVVTGPTETPAEERRQRLLARYQALNKDHKRAYCALRIAPDDLDAVEAALDTVKVEPFNTVIPAPEPRATTAAPVRPPTKPDEGDRVSDADAQRARDEIEALGDRYADVHLVGIQANEAGVGFKITVVQSRRRWEIYRALAALARYGWDEETVRTLLAAATDDPTCCWPLIPLGRIVGSLDVAQATAFADMAVALVLALADV